ncbi:protein FAR1-RELATED SEQUENCE 6-like [Carex rostrata]
MDVDPNEECVDDTVSRSSIHEWDLNKDPSEFCHEKPTENVNLGENQNRAENEGEEVVNVGHQIESEADPDEIRFIAPPAIGDKLDSIVEAYLYWQMYGYQTGFGVNKRTFHKNGDIFVDYKFACNKFKDVKECIPDIAPFPKRRRPLVHTKCPVYMRIMYSTITDRWEVSDMELTHNHDLNPESSFLIPCYRFISLRYKAMMEYNADQGMKAADNIDIVTQIAGGYLKCTFTRKDAKNHLDQYKRSKLRSLGGHDAELLSDYFDERKKYDLDFWYTYKHSKEGHLCNIFWAGGRGRAAYRYFHDVVVMDATYLTNRYHMPLVLFVGVNHHWQSVIFACALLSRETEADYKWCMKKFLACMKGVKPGGILTDQCPSIASGISHVFGDETVHRYCAWHILRKLPEKLGGADNKDGIILLVKDVVYNAKTPIQFEESWLTLMSEIGYENAPWFISMFAQRHKWVPIYLNDRFWAGMNTTQRVEGMNHFLDKYLRAKATLAEFVGSFDSALNRIWQKENDKDFESKTKTTAMYSELLFEKQFAKVYTLTIFYRFQHELRTSVNMTCVFKLELPDSTNIYEVEDIRGHIFEVRYNKEYKEFSCICKLFEASGIVCSHALMVLKHEKQNCINDKYILDRWRKDKNRLGLILAGCDTTNSVENNMRYDLTMSINPIIDDLISFRCASDEQQNIVFNGLEAFRNLLRGNIVSGSGDEDVVNATNRNNNVGSQRSVCRLKGSSTNPKKMSGRKVKGKAVNNSTGKISSDTLNCDWDAIFRTVAMLTTRTAGAVKKRKSKATQNDNQYSSSSENEVLNSAPTKKILPPLASISKGRPRQSAYKNPMDKKK